MRPYQRRRAWLIPAALFSFLPWAFFAVYVPYTGAAGFRPESAAKIFFRIIDVFAPIYYLFDWPGGPMAILAEHTSAEYEFWSWTVLSLLNFAYWCVIFWLLGWVVRRVRRTGGASDAQHE